MIPFEKVYTVKGEEGSSVIIVESTEDKCSYRIEYTDTNIPFLELIASMPYEV